MSRIIAGSAGGRALAVPPRGTRPTTDKVREALFSRLEHQVGLRQARVLDLYAGSGAIALEAVSRGASAVAVESAAGAVATIRRNAEHLGLPLAIVRAPVARYLAGPPPPEPFDIVFADPPYDLAARDVADMLVALARPGWLAEGATVVLEASRRGEPPAWPGSWPSPIRKDYGETTLWYVHELAGAAR